MATVLLGNEAPIEPKAGIHVNDEESDRPGDRGSLPAQTIVKIDTPDADLDGNPIPLSKKLAEIRNAFRVHSKGEPAWVEGHDDDFTKLLTQEFNCELGRPDDWASQRPQEPSSEPSRDEGESDAD